LVHLFSSFGSIVLAELIQHLEMKMSSYPILIRISCTASFEAGWAFAEATKAIENKPCCIDPPSTDRKAVCLKLDAINTTQVQRRSSCQDPEASSNQLGELQRKSAATWGSDSLDQRRRASSVCGTTPNDAW